MLATYKHIYSSELCFKSLVVILKRLWEIFTQFNIRVSVFQAVDSSTHFCKRKQRERKGKGKEKGKGKGKGKNINSKNNAKTKTRY